MSSEGDDDLVPIAGAVVPHSSSMDGDVGGEGADKSVLYDLWVLSPEWTDSTEQDAPARNQIQEVKSNQFIANTKWLLSRLYRVGLIPLSLLMGHEPGVQPPLYQRIDQFPLCKVEFAPNGTVLAVAKSKEIAFRYLSDEFQEERYVWRIPTYDEHPKRAKLAWSDDSLMLAFLTSKGTIYILDSNCHLIHTITPQEIGTTGIIVGVIWRSTNCTWRGRPTACQELLVLGDDLILWRVHIPLPQGGHNTSFPPHPLLHSQNAEAAKGCGLIPSMSVAGHHDSVGCLMYDSASSILAVGGVWGSDPNNRATNNFEPSISTWKVNDKGCILADASHSRISVADEIDAKTRFKRMFMGLARKGEKSDRILYQLAFSPNSEHIAGVVADGSAFIWKVRNLVLVSKPLDEKALAPVWQHSETPSSRAIVGVSWWNDNSIIVVSQGGELVILSVATTRGKSAEVFDKNPVITRTVNGLLFVLESEIINAPSRSESVENIAELNNSRLYALWQTIVGYLDSSDERWHSHSRPHSSANSAPSSTSHHRLIKFQSTTPEQLFRRKVELKEVIIYADALGIAELYGLDSDLVYQKQWASVPVSGDTLLLLSKIHNISWVLWETHVRIPGTPEMVRLLLEFGLRKTAQYLDVEDAADPSSLISADPQKRACLHRLVILQYLDRLNTYVSIYGDTFDGDAYAKFRECDLVAAAIEYAHEENFKALAVLFTYHGSVVLPYTLDILSSIPETSSPAAYADLLPKPDEAWHEERRREEDWVESNSIFQQILGLDNARLGKDLATVCEDMLQRNGDTYEDMRSRETVIGNGEDDVYSIDVRPPSSGEGSLQKIVTPPKHRYGSKEALEAWYMARARAIDRLSGLVSHSQILIIQAIKSGLTELTTFSQKIEELYTLKLGTRFDWRRYEQLDDLHRLTMLLANSTDDTFIDNLKRRGVYLLADKERFSNNDISNYDMPRFRGLFYQYMINLAKSGELYRCLLVFRESSPVPTVHTRIIENSKDLMNTALACVYACQRTDLLEVVDEIFKCLPLRDETVDREDKEYHDLQDKVDLLEEHLKINESFQKYKMAQPMQLFLQIVDNQEVVDNLILEACHFAKRTSEDDIEWKSLCEDMIGIRRSLCPSVQTNVVPAMVAKALLEFKLAGEYLKNKSQVPTDIAEELVVSAAREYFNSAPTYDNPDMAMAKSCLSLMKHSASATKELRLIDAITSLAKDHAYPLLPIQIRLKLEGGNKYEIVQDILANNPKAYQKANSVVKLCHSLAEWPTSNSIYTGVSDSVIAHHLVARAAHKHKDFTIAHKTCIHLMGLPVPPAHFTQIWELFVEVGSFDDYGHDEERLQLLGYALTHCNEDSLMDVLPLWQSLEIKVKCRGVGVEWGSCKPSEDKSREAECLAKLVSLKDELATNSTEESKVSIVPSIHPFYHTVFHTKNSNESSYTDTATPTKESTSGTLYVSQLCSRIQNLYSVDSENEAGLLAMAKESFHNDWFLSLSYLLALRNPSTASTLFEELVSASDGLTAEQLMSFASFYYAAITYSKVHPEQNLFAVPTSTILQYCMDKTLPVSVAELPSMALFKEYRAKFDDATQDRHLKSVNVLSVDITRIRNDEQYKREVITALASSPHQSVLETALGMAKSYDVPVWDVIMDHVDFMLTKGPHSSPTVQTNLAIVLEQADKTEERLKSTYMNIAGTDFPRLVSFFSALQQCHKVQGKQGDEEVHLKILASISDIPSLQALDYKELVKEGDSDPLDVITPVIAEANLAVFLAVQLQLPVVKHSALPEFTPSKVHLVLINKLLYSHIPENDVKRYEECTPYLDKLETNDLVSFFDPVIFGTDIKLSQAVQARACSDALAQLQRLSTVPASIKDWASRIDTTKAHVLLQLNISKVPDAPQDIKSLLQQYQKVEDIFIRAVIMGHSPVLLANLIFATTGPIKKKSPSTTSLFNTPKITEIYVAVFNIFAQTLLLPPTSDQPSEGVCWPPTSSTQSVELIRQIVQNLVQHVDKFTSLFNTIYNKLFMITETPALPLDTRIALLETIVDTYKQVTTNKALKSLDIEDHEQLLRQCKAQDIVKSLWLGTITEEDMTNTSLESVTTLFNKLLEKSPDLPHMQQLTNLLTIWTKNHAPTIAGEASPLHACWLSLYHKLISMNETKQLLRSWESKPFPYLEITEEADVIAALDKSDNLDITFGMSSAFENHILSTLDSLTARFGNPIPPIEWESLNLATPASSPPLTPSFTLNKNFLYSCIKLGQLPKVATTSLLPYFTAQFVNICGDEKLATPKASIEYAVAQLCSAHLHFFAATFLVSTSWNAHSHVWAVGNILQFVDMFLERRGKVMEKKDGWEECRQACADALGILRRDQQL